MKASVTYTVRDSQKNSIPVTLANDIDGSRSLENLLLFTKASLLKISKEVLQQELDAGFDKNYITIVDGRKGKREQDVSPLGKIQYLARQNISKIVMDVYDHILGYSKVLSGRYKRSNAVLINNKVIASSRDELKAYLETNVVTEKDLIWFLNPQPYARKLERLGVTSNSRRQRKKPRKGRDYSRALKRGWSSQQILPNGAYHRTFTKMKGKYGKNVDINFRFVPGDILGLSGNFPGTTTKSGRTKKGRPYLYPVIVLKNLNSTGLIIPGGIQ